MNRVNVWTDGSCYWKTKQGGVGVYIEWNEDRYEYRQGFNNTTTGRMELKAIIWAFQILLPLINTNDYSITIYCDSQYIVNSINKGWVYVWEKDGWLDRKNSDLWVKFLEVFKQINRKQLKVVWIKGHSNIEGNEVANILANYKNQLNYIEDTEDCLVC